MGKRTNTASWIGNRWRIDVQKDGSRKSFYSSTPGRTGQREANHKADAWLDDGIVSNSVHIETLYAEFQKVTAPTVGTSFNRQIEYFGTSWILPLLGKKKLSALCDQDLQSVLNKAAAAGLSKKTIQGINGAMNKFLKYCRRCKLTAFRPEDVQIPASARLKGKTVLQPADLIKLFNSDTYDYYGKRVREPYIHAYRFQVLTGIRPGELRGLRPCDVHGHRVDIVQAINDYGETTKGKNENAVRSFILSDMAYRALEQQRQENPYGEYIFELPSTQCYGKHWKRFCEDNGIKYVSPYELRHTFVSVVKRLPAGEIKPLVGHSEDMDTFGIYSHELDGEAQKIADNINDLFAQLIESSKEVK